MVNVWYSILFLGFQVLVKFQVGLGEGLSFLVKIFFYNFNLKNYGIELELVWFLGGSYVFGFCGSFFCGLGFWVRKVYLGDWVNCWVVVIVLFSEVISMGILWQLGCLRIRFSCRIVFFIVVLVYRFILLITMKKGIFRVRVSFRCFFVVSVVLEKVGRQQERRVRMWEGGKGVKRRVRLVFRFEEVQGRIE